MKRIIGVAMALALALAAAASSAPAQAQAWPTRPVTIVNIGGPGGAVDLMLRIFTVPLQRELGQPFVIDYKPGASGQLGSTVMARAKPDGYTVGVVGGATTVIGPMTQKLQYDPMKDLTFIARFSTQANLIYVKADSPFKTLADLIDYGRKNPGKLSFGSLGNGTTTHLTAASLFDRTGIKALHVPYPSSAPLALAVLGGSIDVAFENVSPAAMGQVKSGQIRPLVVTSKERVPQLPTVPTVAESLIPDFEIVTWYGLAGPAGMPKEAVDRLAATIKKLLAEPQVHESFVAFGVTPSYLAPEDMRKFLAEETARWTPIVKAANIKMQE